MIKIDQFGNKNITNKFVEEEEYKQISNNINLNQEFAVNANYLDENNNKTFIDVSANIDRDKDIIKKDVFEKIHKNIIYNYDNISNKNIS